MYFLSEWREVISENFPCVKNSSDAAAAVETRKISSVKLFIYFSFASQKPLLKHHFTLNFRIILCTEGSGSSRLNKNDEE